MTEKYSREVLKRNVAQICQTIGWSGINSTPVDILVHILEKYIRNLGARSNRYAEQFNRTQPNLHDLGLVFRDLHISLPELQEYTKSVPPVPPPVTTDKYPKPKESNLNFLKPGSHEVVTRPMHVHEHLPPMYPEKEKDQPPLVADTIEIHQNGLDTLDHPTRASNSPEISVTDSPEKQKDIFKRPIDPVSIPNSKRPRLRLEEEDCHTREIKSVMMTMSGFLSPAREGKLPEAKTPTILYDKHEKQKPNSHSSNLMKVPTTLQSAEKSDKKSKKNKSVNGKIMKNKKKDKTHKGDGKHKVDKNDKLTLGFPSRPKEMPNFNHIASIQKPNMLTGSVPVPKPLTIKQEPVDHSMFPSLSVPKVSPRPPNPDKIPVPKKIPKSQSPLVPNNFSGHRSTTPSTLISQDQIKQEPIEEEEKLSSQPDRSKINIFKRISNKSKEDKTSTEVVLEKSEQISRIEASHSASDSRNSVVNKASVEIKSEPISKNGEVSAMDLSKPPDLTSNEVISIDDDSLEYNPPTRPIINPPTIRKDLFDSPKLVPRKMDELLAAGPNLSSPKIKKERKHKEKKEKMSMEKAVKILRKQQQQLAFEMAMQQGDKSNIPYPAKTPKSRTPKGDSSKIPQMPPGFPFFPTIPPGRGLIPGPGLIPNPADLSLLAGLNNPALRGLSSNNLLANPYALGVSSPGLIPGPNFMPGSSGMLSPNMPNHIMPMANTGQLPRSAKSLHPFLRRPSLEVIPVEDDGRRGPPIQLPMREKEKHDKHKMSSIPNILQKHSASKSKAKINPVSKMPFIQPDVTIKLNPPRKDPPNIPVPVLVPVKKEAKPLPPPISSPEPDKEDIKPATPEPCQVVVPSELATSTSDTPKDKTEKKKEKLHKKEKRDKDGLKVKKKKDKKDKTKHKSEKTKEKEGSVDVEIKDKIKKEKKEKKKDKERPPSVEPVVPKLTLKLGSASPMPPSSPEVFKLNIKPIVKKDPETPQEDSPEPSRSPEVAQFAALVTRPPKQKHLKSNHVSPEEAKSSSSQGDSGSSPTRKNKPPGSVKKTKLFFKTMVKKSKIEDGDDSDITLIPEEPPPQSKEKKPVQLSTPYYTDEHGNKVWVCPACGMPDNGSPMIGCDGCDGWYHWVCVGITEDPGSSEDWFCKSCIAKRTAMATALAGGIMSGKKRGRKSKTDVKS